MIVDRNRENDETGFIAEHIECIYKEADNSVEKHCLVRRDIYNLELHLSQEVIFSN